MSRRGYDAAVGLLVEEAEPALPSVLDLLSDDAAGLDSALPPLFEPFAGSPFAGEDDSFVAGSFAPDSELVAFFLASDG